MRSVIGSSRFVLQRSFMGLGGSKQYKSMSIFDNSVENINGEQIALSTLKGAKAYLVINVASK